MIGQLDSLLEQLDALQARAIEQLEPIQTSAELEEWDTNYLGRKRGELTNLSSVMSKLAKEERPIVGQKVNAVKAELMQRLAAKREALRQRELLQALEEERIDVTLPGRAMPVGHMHPISRTIWEVTQACDLACVHCRASAQPLRHPEELTNAEGKQLIDQIASWKVPVSVSTPSDKPSPSVSATNGLVGAGTPPFIRLTSAPSETPSPSVSGLFGIVPA